MDQDSLVDPLHMQYEDYMVQDGESRKINPFLLIREKY